MDPLSARPRPQGQHRDAAQRDHKEDWDRGLGRARGEDQLKQRTGITHSLLQRSQWTVPAPDEESSALHRQRRQSGAKQPVAASRKRTKPDISKTAELHHSYRDMTDSQGPGLAAQLTELHAPRAYPFRSVTARLEF
jgi:hypothetical protein